MSTLFAELPALPLHTAGKYVAAAYIVFMLVIVVYVAIMAVRLTRSQNEILELHRELEEREAARDEAGSPASAGASESHPHGAAQARGAAAVVNDPAESEQLA